jgi:ATP-binding protein involved in chromosome partitioning
MITKEQVIEALSYVDDPDLKKDLITLNMVKDIEVNGNNVSFTVVLTTPACPMKDLIERACFNAIKHYVSQDAEVNITMTANVTSSKRATNMLPNVKNIIAVASGKGGVGKSTVASNLAVALAKQGAKVGLVDADIYGPSAHIMFGLKTEKPEIRELEDGRSIMIPIEQYGVKVLSIGFLIDPNQPVVWRGPMASKALQQLFTDAYWGDLDYMLIDLPPGTGDIHLTLVASVPVTGAVIVSTPQAVALADARKGLNMFQLESVNVPILGLVENMAYFTPAELPENKYYIFGKDGCKNLAEKLEIPFLGQIPLVQSICENGDNGTPIVLEKTSPSAIAFTQLAENLAQQIAIRNAQQAPTQKVEPMYK